MSVSRFETNFSIIAACIPTVLPFFSRRNQPHDRESFHQLGHQQRLPRIRLARDPFPVTGLFYPDSQHQILEQESHPLTESSDTLRPSTKASSLIKQGSRDHD